MNAWIGLGSNLGDGAGNIARALEMLQGYEEIRVLRTSSLYLSKPQGFSDQPDFTNAVAELSVATGTVSLLGRLKEVERRMGRRKTLRWGPRLIDLDLLLAGDAILFLPGLTVPHPRMHRRAFVLAPLAELEPGLRIPARGTVRSCLARVGDQKVTRAGAVEWS